MIKHFPVWTAAQSFWSQQPAVHSMQASRVWDPGQKPTLSLGRTWLRSLQLSFPPLGAAIHDELLEFATHLKEVFLELPSAAHAQALPGKQAQPHDEHMRKKNEPFLSAPVVGPPIPSQQIP